MKIGHKPERLTLQEAQTNLEQVVRGFCKQFCKWPYRTKLPYLQGALIEIKLARRALNEKTATTTENAS